MHAVPKLNMNGYKGLGSSVIYKVDKDDDKVDKVGDRLGYPWDYP